MSSKVEVLSFDVDGLFEIALVSASIAVLNDELIPSCKEDILGWISSEDVIVVIQEGPGEGRTKGTVRSFVATLKYLVRCETFAPASAFKIDHSLG